jgi:hypothetical protein
MVLVKAMTNSTCKTYENGTKFWYNDKGELHRENDLPAVEYVSGYKSWYLNGELHRETGPAVEYADGTKLWLLNDKYHRENGPACEYADGSKFWYLNGKRHREEGPAREYANGTKEWWVDDERVYCTDNETFLRMMKFKWCW